MKSLNHSKLRIDHLIFVSELIKLFKYLILYVSPYNIKISIPNFTNI